jgi:hypothetical protein
MWGRALYELAERRESFRFTFLTPFAMLRDRKFLEVIGSIIGQVRGFCLWDKKEVMWMSRCEGGLRVNLYIVDETLRLYHILDLGDRGLIGFKQPGVLNRGNFRETYHFGVWV